LKPILAGLGMLLVGPGAMAGPVNDNFASSITLTGANGTANGLNVGALPENGEPTHAGFAPRRSVWWRWVAPKSGTVTFDTKGSNFDTILAIYSGTTLGSLLSQGENDGGSVGPEAVVIFPAQAGVIYQICVDGVNAAVGTIVLNWRTDFPCPSPYPPGPPNPTDGQNPVTPSQLTWSPGGGEERVPEKIYGTDNRKDIYQVTDPALVKLWESTVVVVSRSDLHNNGNGTYSLPSTSLQVMENVCPTERFAAQPSPGFCSGFLVAPQVMATAGHCVETSSDCGDTAFVFGFKMADATTPVLTFPAAQVYFCSGIIASYHPDDLADWALIRLDRQVPDHAPLPIRRLGKIQNNQNIFVIGHPLGLPAKLADGAWVRDNSTVDSFLTNLDTYGGNSGSAVFNADTRLVEGILVAGDPIDLEFRGNCLVSSVCPDTQCLGEEVTRSIQFAHLVPYTPQRVYQVYLGPCGNLTLQGETAQAKWNVSGLAPKTLYCWKIVVRDECGSLEGPVWSFTTTSAPAFRRGDPSPDGQINISDPIAVLFDLFAAEPVGCREAADFDDNGTVDLSDVIGLLDSLFLGGVDPAAPFPGCGSDPSTDSLGCGSYEACGL
jgi:trypsin-like peptidase